MVVVKFKVVDELIYLVKRISGVRIKTTTAQTTTWAYFSYVDGGAT